MDSTVAAAVFTSLLTCCLPFLFTQVYRFLLYLVLACCLNVYILISVSPTVWTILLSTSPNSWKFLCFFFFRYLRLVVNTIAFHLYDPIAVPDRPKIQTTDVSVIIPTVEGSGDQFRECIRSVYRTRPARIIVVTAGPGTYDRALKTLCTYPDITIKHCSVQNKRKQVSLGLQEV